jgi:phosphoribosylformimino-5-aminoimidazole carboxamide ribotide isomerase
LHDGLVATEGWAQKTDLHVVDLSKKIEQDGVSSIVYTDTLTKSLFSL